MLYSILKALSKDQLRALDKFIRSPYLVTHAGVGQLFLYLKANLHRPEEDVMRRAALLAALGEERDPRRVHHVLSYLQEAVEQFLALEQWGEQSQDQHRGSIAGLRHLRLDEAAASMLRYARKRLAANPLRGAEYLRADYGLHYEAFYLSQQQGRAKTFNLQELSDAQDVAFLCEKLRMGCLLLSHQAVAKQTYDEGLLNPVLAFLKDHPYLEIPAVAVYYHGYFAQLGQQDSEHHFQQLKSLLEAHAARFSASEVHDLYLMAINFCIRRINQADERYFRELFDLYQSGLRHGALLEDGLLSRWTYTNITATGLRLGEHDWVRAFLHDYAPHLAPAHRDGAFHFNFARYLYDTGDRREALPHLLRMDYDDVHQNLLAKVLLAKIYYELKETAALDSHLDSIQAYLRRQKVVGYHRDLYTGVVRYLRKIMTLNVYDEQEKQRLRQEIEQSPGLHEREWLLRKVEELRG